MHKDDDTAFADNYAERDQARALREQARTGGLRFEAYLPGDMADWLLAQVEQGHFVDPSEAVFAIVKNFIDMEPHRDLRDELLRLPLEVRLDLSRETVVDFDDRQPRYRARPLSPPRRLSDRELGFARFRQARATARRLSRYAAPPQARRSFLV